MPASRQEQPAASVEGVWQQHQPASHTTPIQWPSTHSKASNNAQCVYMYTSCKSTTQRNLSSADMHMCMHDTHANMHSHMHARHRSTLRAPNTTMPRSPPPLQNCHRRHLAVPITTLGHLSRAPPPTLLNNRPPSPPPNTLHILVVAVAGCSLFCVKLHPQTAHRLHKHKAAHHTEAAQTNTRLHTRPSAATQTFAALPSCVPTGSLLTPAAAQAPSGHSPRPTWPQAAAGAGAGHTPQPCGGRASECE